MKNILLVLLFLVTISCKDESKKEILKPETTNVKQDEKDKVSSVKIFPIEEDITMKLKYIFDNDFVFDKGLVLESIGLVEVDKDLYKFVFILEKGLDFKRISEDLNFGMIFYPSDESLLETETEKKRGSIKTGIGTKIKQMGEHFVFTLDEFRLLPKNFKTVRFYFYNKNGVGIVGDNLILTNVSI
ncbi:hypothetical protein CLV86_1828 [Lacinutrix venerupis]|uniref:hypothetical protein n=1 Tax=Lacinutrix venerupis TaxID=1486034 RepID=UPI000EB02C4D|nr:hypothetical protein [Lacinutrix venerupis]RLJ63291.1 hypothetical protein CLV86_1828 [Lacinutrix venerupis]